MTSFELSPFEKNAILVVDFDGTVAEFVDDPKNARPHPIFIQAVRDFLNQSDSHEFHVLSSRSTRFFATIDEFKKLIRDFPSHVAFHGYYGMQTWSTRSDHVVPGELEEYESEFADVYHSHDFSALVLEWKELLLAQQREDIASALAELDLRDVIFENRGFVLTLHARRLLSELGLLAKEKIQGEIATHIKNDIEKCAVDIAEEMNHHGSGVTVKSGSMISEIMPAGFAHFEKARTFVTLREESATDEGARPTYFAGDDKGDVSVFSLGSHAPEITTIFVDSSPLDRSSELTLMRSIADVHIVGDERSAVENFARILKNKICK